MCSVCACGGVRAVTALVYMGLAGLSARNLFMAES